MASSRYKRRNHWRRDLYGDFSHNTFSLPTRENTLATSNLKEDYRGLHVGLQFLELACFSRLSLDPPRSLRTSLRLQMVHIAGNASMACPWGGINLHPRSKAAIGDLVNSRERIFVKSEYSTEPSAYSISTEDFWLHHWVSREDLPLPCSARPTNPGNISSGCTA